MEYSPTFQPLFAAVQLWELKQKGLAEENSYMLLKWNCMSKIERPHRNGAKEAERIQFKWHRQEQAVDNKKQMPVKKGG